jgi:hypothetical protein
MKTLEKWKRNEIYNAVEAAGLRPEAFVWDDAADDICLRHLSSETYFVFGGHPGKYVTRYAAGDATGPELDSYSWGALMERVETWLHFVKSDSETPDLWDQLRRQTELLSGSSEDSLENTPFTPDEQDDIAKQLNELREYWKGAYALTESQLKDLDSKIDYLNDAATRLGRKDWLNACIGTVFAWVVVTALPPDASRHVLGMLLSGIAHFFGHHLPGLGSG